MKSRLATTTVAAAALAALTFGAASLEAAGSNVIGTKNIGGYRVGSGYTQAKRLFGQPHASTQSGRVCTARWTNGVTITWHRTLPYSNWAKACVKFSQSKVVGSWRTNRGLTVGASGSKLKKLYPAAKHT